MKASLVEIPFSASLDSVWLSEDPVVIGHRALNRPSPDAFLLVQASDARLRLDVYFSEPAMPAKAWKWESNVVVSPGSFLFICSIPNRTVRAFPIDAYVTTIQSAFDLLFVSTASEVLVFDGAPGLVETYAGLGFEMDFKLSEHAHLLPFIEMGTKFQKNSMFSCGILLAIQYPFHVRK